MNPRMLFFVIFGVVVLGGMFFVLKPQEKTQTNISSPHPSLSTPVKQAASSRPAPGGEGKKETEKQFILEVKEKKLVSGPQTLSVTQGDTVTIVITSDESEELHVHGYDKSVDLEPNKQAKLTFVADQAGRFPYELEIAKVDIGALEVQPK